MTDQLDRADIARKEAKEEPQACSDYSSDGSGVCTRCGQWAQHHVTEHHEVMQDDREAVARAMLNQWRALANQTDQMRSPHYRDLMNKQAEEKLLEILELMGVDIGPLELAPPGQTNIVRELGEMDNFTP